MSLSSEESHPEDSFENIKKTSYSPVFSINHKKSRKRIELVCTSDIFVYNQYPKLKKVTKRELANELQKSLRSEIFRAESKNSTIKCSTKWK